MTSEVCKREDTHTASADQCHQQASYSPRIDICENDDELVLYADVPGVASEDLDIQFENGELRIHGAVKPRHENAKVLLSEYGLGDFYRTFTINETINADAIKAELRHGVLALHLPKADAVKPRKIQVQSN